MVNDSAKLSNDPRSHKDLSMFHVITDDSLDNSTKSLMDDDGANLMEGDDSNDVKTDRATVLAFLVRIKEAERNPPTTLLRKPIYSPVTSIRPKHNEVKNTTSKPVRLTDMARTPVLHCAGHLGELCF